MAGRGTPVAEVRPGAGCAVDDEFSPATITPQAVECCGPSATLEDILAFYIREPALVFQAVAEDRDDLSPLVNRVVLADEDWFRHLCGATAVRLPVAIAAVGVLGRSALNFEVSLARKVVNWPAEPGMSLRIVRALQILGERVTDSRINQIIVPLARSGNRMIRSKARALIVRCCPDTGSLERYLEDSDPRVTANVLEAVVKSCVGREWIRKVAGKYAEHENNRVAANAAIGLYLAGDESGALRHIDRMATDARPLFRSSAAWAMGKMPGAGFKAELDRLWHDSSHLVRWSVLRSLIRLQKQTSRPA